MSLIHSANGAEILDLLATDLTTNPMSPPVLRDAVSLGPDGSLQIDFPVGMVATDDWFCGGGHNDTGLGGSDQWTWNMTFVPEPASLMLLALGGLLARARRAV